VFHWGKLIGVGLGWFTTGDVPGVLIGLGLGYIVDNCVFSVNRSYSSQNDSVDLAQVQKEFFIATFSVMGYVDELVSRPHHQIYDTLNKVAVRLNLSDEVFQEAADLYCEGMSSEFNLNKVILPFYAACHSQKFLLEKFLEMQLHAAFDGNSLHPDRQAALLDICLALELTEEDFERILDAIKAEYQYDKNGDRSVIFYSDSSVSLDDAYNMLNISSNASNDEIKKAYRRLTNMHHPDKLIAKGLPEEILKLSENKTREIRMAYERIRELRNF